MKALLSSILSSTMCIAISTLLAFGPPVVRADSVIGTEEFPLTWVIQQTPEYFGPLLTVVTTSVPGLEIIVTVPVYNDESAANLVQSYCAANLAECETTPLEDLPFYSDPILNNKEWVMYSLWDISPNTMTLYNASSYGRIQGEERWTSQFVSALPAAQSRVQEWRSALLAIISAGNWADPDLLRSEINSYEVLTDDPTVFRALQVARGFDEDCNSRPSLARCRTCCEDIHDECDSHCGFNGMVTGLSGCVLLGSLCGLFGTPAAGAACCAAGFAFGTGAGAAKCNIRCAKDRKECMGGCDETFPDTP